MRIESQIGGERHGWLDRPLVHRALCGPVRESACCTARIVCDTYERSAFAGERPEEADTRRLAIDYARWLHVSNRYEPAYPPVPERAVLADRWAMEPRSHRDTPPTAADPWRALEAGRFAPGVEASRADEPPAHPCVIEKPVTRRAILQVVAPTGRFIDVFA